MDPIIGYVITGIISLVVGLALQRSVGKAKLQYFLPGTFLFNIDNPKVSLQTDSLTIQNSGRKSSTNIEIVHKAKPDHFQFSQAIAYKEEFNPNGEHILKITSLGPKEHLNIQYLSHTTLPVLLRVRSDQGSAQLIQVQFQPVFPKYIIFLIVLLMLSGFGGLTYVAIKAVYFISQLLVAT
jgi:hypothetical protein